MSKLLIPGLEWTLQTKEKNAIIVYSLNQSNISQLKSSPNKQAYLKFMR